MSITTIPTLIPITTIPTVILILITTILTPIPPKLTTNDSDSDSDSGVGIAPGLVCARMCAFMHMRVCVIYGVRAFVGDVFAIYDNKIWLIMIIIKINSYKSHTLMISPQREPG